MGIRENQGIEFSDKYELALNLYPKIRNYKYRKRKTIYLNKKFRIQIFLKMLMLCMKKADLFNAK